MATTARDYDPYAIPTRRMTREQLLEAAGYFGVDPASLDTETLRSRIKRAAESRWLEENREAIDEFNAWVRENGIPHADLHPL